MHLLTTVLGLGKWLIKIQIIHYRGIFRSAVGCCAGPDRYNWEKNAGNEVGNECETWKRDWRERLERETGKRDQSDGWERTGLLSLKASPMIHQRRHSFREKLI
jgi:hypothetical protein